MSICVFTALSLAPLGAGALMLPQAFFSTLPSTSTAAGIKVKCMGSPGHGSRFISNTAAEKMVREVAHPVHPPPPALGCQAPAHGAGPHLLPFPPQHKVITSFLAFRESEKQR